MIEGYVVVNPERLAMWDTFGPTAEFAQAMQTEGDSEVWKMLHHAGYRVVKVREVEE